MKYDIHIHTDLSACAARDASPCAYIERAAQLGISIIGFSNHFWDSKISGASDWYKPQDFANLLKLRDQLPDDTQGVTVLFGAEGEYRKDGVLAVAPETAEQLDYLLIPHSHTHMTGLTIDAADKATPQKHAAYLVKSFMNTVESPIAPYLTAIAHPFFAVGCPECEQIIDSVSDRELTECFTAAKEADIACEINCSYFSKLDDPTQTGFMRMFTAAKECGCSFTIGSDAHKTDALGSTEIARAIMNYCGIGDDKLVIPTKRHG